MLYENHSGIGSISRAELRTYTIGDGATAMHTAPNGFEARAHRSPCSLPEIMGYIIAAQPIAERAIV